MDFYQQGTSIPAVWGNIDIPVLGGGVQVGVGSAPPIQQQLQQQAVNWFPVLAIAAVAFLLFRK